MKIMWLFYTLLFAHPDRTGANSSLPFLKASVYCKPVFQRYLKFICFYN